MTWFKVDDTFYGHPKLTELEQGSCYFEAISLWVLAGSWCAAQLTDGAIPAGQIRKLGCKKRAAEELVRVGLWERTTTGYAYHDWAKYQPTREEIEVRRRATAERVRRSRNAARNAVTDRATDAATSDVRNDVSNASPVPSRPVLDPSPTLPAEGSGAIAWSEGEVPGDVLHAVRVAHGGSAAEFSAAVLGELRARGWAVDCEVDVPDRGDGRPGRIDAVVRKGSEVVALELDRCAPRAKSVAKLRSYQSATARAVAVRNAASSAGEVAPELVQRAIAREAAERDTLPAPSIADRDASRAAERANELLRDGLYAEPERAAEALVRAAFDLALGPQQRPLRFALLEATVGRPNGRSRAQAEHVPPEDPWV